MLFGYVSVPTMNSRRPYNYLLDILRKWYIMPLAFKTEISRLSVSLSIFFFFEDKVWYLLDIQDLCSLQMDLSHNSHPTYELVGLCLYGWTNLWLFVLVNMSIIFKCIESDVFKLFLQSIRLIWCMVLYFWSIRLFKNDCLCMFCL